MDGEFLNRNRQRLPVDRIDASLDAVEDLLAAAPASDDVVHPQQPQVMTDRWLRKIERFAQGTDVLLAA